MKKPINNDVWNCMRLTNKTQWFCLWTTSLKSRIYCDILYVFNLKNLEFRVSLKSPLKVKFLFFYSISTLINGMYSNKCKHFKVKLKFIKQENILLTFLKLYNDILWIEHLSFILLLISLTLSSQLIKISRIWIVICCWDENIIDACATFKSGNIVLKSDCITNPFKAAYISPSFLYVLFSSVCNFGSIFNSMIIITSFFIFFFKTFSVSIQMMKLTANLFHLNEAHANKLE